MTSKTNFIISKDNKPHPYDFVQLYDKENIIKMQSYCDESIIETAKGRYDVRVEKVKQEFKTVPENPTIANLMKLYLQERFLCDIGLLVTGSHAKVDFFLAWYVSNLLISKYYIIFIYFLAAGSALLSDSVLYVEEKIKIKIT